MTSPDNQGSAIASNPPAKPATTSSYASAAGAASKPSSTPLVATGSAQPVVAAGSSTLSSSQHAKSSSVSPLNGRPNIMPAVPSVPAGAPAVAHGTSNTNGAADSHARTPSVTINNGSNNFSANGQPKSSNIQFGFQDSPAATHSTPQTGAAPIAIPGAHANPRVTSPQQSPSPIPQPSASGGARPLSGAQQGGAMTFGSFGGDSDRPHMRTPSASQDPNALGSQPSPHMRRSSSHSHTEMPNQPMPPQGMGRGSFAPTGRGRGGNFYNGQQAMGFPPGNNYRGPPNQGRGGGMPPNFPNNRQPPYGSPIPASRSPALPPAMPHQANMGPNMQPNFYYPPPAMGPSQGPPQNFYPTGPYDPNMRPGMPMPSYPVYPMMQQQSPAPTFQQPYAAGPYPPPGGQPMSRNSSQVSNDYRPPSSASQHQVPAPGQGTPQTHHAQLKPAVVASPQFNRPAKKSAAIPIKTATGNTIDLTHLKAPSSPAPSSQQSRTPPNVAPTPTPPPKSITPAHSRNESTSGKSAEEIRNEFKEKIRAGKEQEAPKAVAETKAKSEAAAQEVTKVEVEPKPADSTTDAKKDASPPKKEEPPQSQETEEDEMERIIREMEEADAKREKEEEERRVKKAAENEAKKKAEAETRAATAAENDRKLREAEREMERLEEEKEARAKAGVSAPSVHDLLSGKTSEPTAAGTEAGDATEKMANLSLEEKTSGSAAKAGPGGRGPKPAALNLAPLKTGSVEPPQPSAALQSLKTARLLDVIKTDIYPPNVQSPNPALNAAVSKKGTSFKYDAGFLLQFKGVFTEAPSIDFNQQVKSLIGDDGGRSASARTPATARQNSNRAGSSSFAPMGNFGSGKTLPPGTTSADRFAMSNGAAPRPGMGQMGSFAPRAPGVFPGGSQMSRNPSNSMGMPNSPRQGSRANRTASRQNTTNAKQEAAAAKAMPLTANMKIEALTPSTSGWKPTSLGKGPSAAASGPLDALGVQRKVKAALNKMTPENFERVSEQILQIAAQSKDETDGRTLRQVIQLTFEKATDEAHWASMYAKFCKKMLDTMSPEIRDESIRDRNGQVVGGGALFRKYLLNRCQEEFERGWKIALPEPKDGEGKPGEAAMLSDEYYKAAAAKRRGLGLVQFIGELYKLAMLTERIMHECVKKLVDYQGIPDEAEVESLSKLLRTIGGNLDATDKGRLMMDVYFQRIDSTVELPDLPSRLKFMLMDVVDLRKAGWVSKDTNKGPKTLDEVRAEAEAAAAAKQAEAARSNQRGGPGRPQMGRGDARGYPGGFPQANQNQVGMDDLRRLKGGANRTSSSNVTLGPMSMLGSRSNSGRRLGPGGSLSRGADDSGASSRTGTPPVRENQSSTNAFSLLATMDSENPASPPSTAASPAMQKAAPDSSATAEKESS